MVAWIDVKTSTAGPVPTSLTMPAMPRVVASTLFAPGAVRPGVAATRRCVAAALLVWAFACGATARGPGDTPLEPAPTGPADAAAGELDAELYQWHAQLTSVTQRHGDFRSPYQGVNSLRSSEPAMETVDLTLYLGVRLWRGAQFYVNPEIDQGYGLSNTLGVAGFTSGEAYKVGNWQPYYRMARVFVRQTFALAEDSHHVDSAANQLAGAEPDQRITLTVGKFSVGDLFDNNAYAHDPRADFLNWAVIDAGAFDYAADAWGYTIGAAMEWTRGDWTLRGGYFAMSTEPNGESLDTTFAQNFQVAEVERRFRWRGRPGAWRLLGFVDRGHFGRYQDALDQVAGSAEVPELARVRRGATKAGWAANVEQEVADGIGLFARISASNGAVQAIEFTEINRSLAVGASVQGGRWGRPDDAWGLAGVINGLSAPARAYFAAGGIGILIGDGQLAHYRSEQVLETYYSWQLHRAWHLSADFQYVAHPAYNADRGPVRVFGLRVHADY